jgi:signal transduction histidine kinase
MARLRLRTQLLFASLLIICALTGALLLTVHQMVRSEIQKQMHESTDASLRAFGNVQQHLELQLSRTAAVLAELPTLKALMTTDDALTIQDGSQPFWKLAGSDLFLLANSNGQILGFHVKRPGWAARLAEPDLMRSIGQGEGTAWWYADGKLYWVFLNPITAGPINNRESLGFVALGYQVDTTVARQLAVVPNSQIVLATADSIIASTLRPDQESELQQWLGREGSGAYSGTHEVDLNGGKFQVSSVLIHNGLPAPVRCYVLVSLQPANDFIQRLSRTIFVLGISAVLLAALLLSFFSLTITHPLDDLVAGVRALAAGDFTYSITTRGSSEVVELGTAFSKMRGELLVFQQRKIANERITALGRAASSISHDLRHFLAALVANAEFLYEAEKLKLNRDEIYEEIQTASHQMTDLLDSLRELAQEGITICPAPCALDQTARRAVEAVLTRPEFRNRSIVIRTSGEMDGVFDAKKIERAFFNLLLNACESTEPGRGQIKLDIVSSAESFEVRVADNGPGIPTVIRGTLFDPFVSSGKPNGTGLGLAIVNKAVHDHAGSIVLVQTSESGTIFLVKFPRFTHIASANQEPVTI